MLDTWGEEKLVAKRDSVGVGWALLFLMLIFSSAGYSQDSNSTVHFGEPAAWVDSSFKEANPGHEVERPSSGQAYILWDTQVMVSKDETFVHLIKEITSDKGLQTGGNLVFSYDPSYQQLVIHQISIHRNGTALNKLEPSKFRIIQQESDLYRQIYNGTQSALLFLEDLRVGDRVEYAFTLKGRNPVLNGFAASFSTQLGVPLANLRYRLLWPKQRRLNYKSHGTSHEPAVHDVDGMDEYTWELHNVPAVELEDRTPAWVNTYSWVQISEYESWSQVAQWADGLFVMTNLDTPELHREAERLIKADWSNSGRLLAALEFVQKEIRYLGIEFGPNSHRPTEPDRVLERRYGDCKDKALLLSTLLRQMGFRAVPVLVSSGFGPTVPQLLPSPYDFNHVIVRVTDLQQTYWIDPTASYQKGPLRSRSRPDYQYGLIIQSGESRLTRIPPVQANTDETVTAETFYVGGQREPTRLHVVTRYAGADAERMRAVLASEGAEGLGKDYLNDYARRYPGIYRTAPMGTDDSDRSGELTFTQNFSITNFWNRSAEGGFFNCEFYPLGVHTWLMPPNSVMRTQPIEVSFPRHRIVETEIHLPRIFRVTSRSNYITGPAGSLLAQQTSTGKLLVLTYDYRAKTNFVAVSRIGEYLQSLEKMERQLAYGLNWEDDATPAGAKNWPIILTCFCYTLLLLAGFGWAYYLEHQHSKNRSTPPPIVRPELVGIGGWLILVGFNLLAGLLIRLSSMNTLYGILSSARWHSLTSPQGMSYQPGYASTLTWELFGGTTLIFVLLMTGILFLQKRRGFPRWFIILLVGNLIFVLIDHWLASSLHPVVTPGKTDQLRTGALPTAVLGVIGACMIWITYVLKSERVRGTFVR